VRPLTATQDCFKGSELRRTEIACLAWAGQVLGGSTFANNPTYFLQQGRLCSDISPPYDADSVLAGFDTKNSFNVGLGAKGLAFIGTCGSWVALSYWGRRPVFVCGLAILSVTLLLVGGVGFAADTNPNARWGSAALVLVWVFVYDFTVGVSIMRPAYVEHG
jgi:SP family general alpha glucoside:H+ symporter-like MFS transporter